MYYLLVLETLAVLALMIFNGVWSSKSKKEFSVDDLPELLQIPFYLLLATVFLSVLPQHGVDWKHFMPTIIVMHTMLLFVNGVFLILALTKFADIPFKYAKQYLFARGALYFAVVFEGFALGAFVACCVLQLF